MPSLLRRGRGWPGGPRWGGGPRRRPPPPRATPSLPAITSSPTWALTSSTRIRCRRRRLRCSSRAGIPRCCLCATWCPMLNSWARRWMTRPERPSTRWRDCWACRTPVVPRLIGPQSTVIRLLSDFSFSGLKTAVARWSEQCEMQGRTVPVADVAASFREAVVDVLVSKALRACAELAVPRLLLGGGVVANARLRDVTTARAAAAGVSLRIPPLALCTHYAPLGPSLPAHPT